MGLLLLVQLIEHGKDLSAESHEMLMCWGWAELSISPCTLGPRLQQISAKGAQQWKRDNQTHIGEKGGDSSEDLNKEW